MTEFLNGNQVQLLRNGADYFPALETAIKNAQSHVYLQTYIYEADHVGGLIGNALMHAAQRGVVVNILLDGFGSKDLPNAFVQALEAAGVRVMFYRPKISPWTLKKSRLRRLHRKVAVIDGKIGFVGGINIIDDYNVPHQLPPRLDYAVRLEGSLLPELLDSVQKLWRRIAWVHMRSLDKNSVIMKASHTLHYTMKNETLSHGIAQDNSTSQENVSHHGMKAAFLMRDNGLHRHDIEDAYLIAIENAKNEIIIANAYFVPGRRFRKALLAARKRGVTVRLLLQGRMEYFLMFATHAFYSVFLRHGIEIHEYHPGFMHSKVAVIDCCWATVGSSNIDPFSLLLAREANVVILDEAFAATLRADIMRSIQNSSRTILPDEWAKGHSLKRLLSWFAFGLVRWFIGLLGFSKDQ